MSQEPRKVGKHTLESLTVGMYEDSRTIFREYIQNSADAIDEAISKGIISKKDSRIDIWINKEQREIRIRDNGIGIAKDDVHNILGDIGNSRKNHTENRGFRGIGRLGGLGYCNELRFVTSHKGEAYKTIMVWDCKELKRLLQPNVNRNMSLIEVVDAVTISDNEPEQINEHYFEVILTGIAPEYSKLLESEDIEIYLSQVAPIPFDYQGSMVLQNINPKLKELGREVEEFNIYLNGVKLYKLYKYKVLLPQGDRDHIKDIEFFMKPKPDNSLWFLGWYSVTDLRGIIKDDNISGLRLRKGNIQIGSHRILDSLFAEDRFNHYFAGEIYVFDDDLIPNSRRDNFEENEAYSKLRNVLQETARSLGQRVRNALKTRSVDKLDIQLEELLDQVDDPTITDAKREKITEKLQDISKRWAQNKPKALPTTNATNEPIKTKPSPIVPDRVTNQPINEKPNGGIVVTTTPSETKPLNTTTVPSDSQKQGTETVIPITSDNDKVHRENILRQKHEEVSKKIAEVKKRLDPPKNERTRPSDCIPTSYPREVRNVIDRVFEVVDRTIADPGFARELKERICEELNKPKKEEKRK